MRENASLTQVPGSRMHLRLEDRVHLRWQLDISGLQDGVSIERRCEIHDIGPDTLACAFLEPYDDAEVTRAVAWHANYLRRSPSNC